MTFDEFHHSVSYRYTHQATTKYFDCVFVDKDVSDSIENSDEMENSTEVLKIKPNQ